MLVTSSSQQLFPLHASELDRNVRVYCSENFNENSQINVELTMPFNRNLTHPHSECDVCFVFGAAILIFEVFWL